MKRLPPSELTRQKIRELLGEGTEKENPVSELVRLSLETIIEEALEAKLRDVLGRGYYEHGGEAKDYRNGYREGRLKTSEGEVRYAVPQTRRGEAAGVKEVRELLGGRSEELERLAVEMYARGCSTRDIEAIFRGEKGESLLSKSAVSELSEVLWKEYEEFAQRDLSEVKPLYLFLDGIAERLRAGAKREAVLCAWAITWEGKKVLVHLSPGTKESTDCCRDFIEDMKRRGLSDPVLVATDGAPGLIRAVEECFPTSKRQRCLAHRMRNLMSKIPSEIAAEFKKAAKAAYEAPSVSMARALRDDLVERFESHYPTAVRCFQEDFEACIAHLYCPPAHHRAIRTTNLLERLFGEERRRMKAVGTLFGERAVLKLMYSALIRASENWRGIRVNEFERIQLERLLEQIREGFEKEHSLGVKKDSTRGKIHSEPRT